ncbi:MAG: hypothetical protein ACRAUW_00365 [Aeromonas sp.]|uniref:hypothetical protein n=1 Tax=Aeromonas sp. TaxID=647 RepID=UPI003D6C0C58
MTLLAEEGARLSVVAVCPRTQDRAAIGGLWLGRRRQSLGEALCVDARLHGLLRIEVLTGQHFGECYFN